MQTETDFTNKTATAPMEKFSDTESNGNEGQQSCIEFGWRTFRPRCLQFLNNPKWFLAAIVIYSLCQGTIALGLINFVLPSIERRFSLSSKELGIIASANDVSALLLVVFISFYGGYGNKIKWMGGGAVLVGVGTLLFSLPHFMVGNYTPVDVRTSGLCRGTNATINQGVSECKVASSGEWYYLMIFVVAQLIIGAGVSPFYSLLPAYLDENVDPKSMPVYLGIWFCFNLMGPGIGFAIGGKFLSIYVDIKQPPGFNLTQRDPRWIGAWWLGFLIFGSIITLWSAVMLGFPRDMPGAKERRIKHIRRGHIRDADHVTKPTLSDILPELKSLLINWTFLFNSLGITIALLYVASLSAFISKIFRLKFGLDPETTGYVLALIAITSILFGSLFGAITVRMFSLKETCKKAAMMCLVCYSFTSIGPLGFLIPGCMNNNLAGIAVPYHNVGLTRSDVQTTPLVSSLPLKSSCNSNCRCSLKTFSPVCGADSVTYFDACHAGCKLKLPNKTFTSCSCISDNPNRSLVGGGTAELGYCDRSCKNVALFTALCVLVLMIRFSMAVPQKTVLLRCVPDNKRAFATGVQYMMYKTLGLLPGPIIFGHLVDQSCKLWQDSCGKKGRCFDYDIEDLSRTVAIYGTTISSVASFCFFMSWYLCKPQLATDGDQAIENPEANSSPTPEETHL